MNRLLFAFCLTLTSAFVSGCGQSSAPSAPADQAPAITSGSSASETPADSGAPWYEVEYYFAGDEVPSGACPSGRLRLDGNFNYTYSGCSETKSGQLTPAQLRELETAWREASQNLDSELVCENVGISAEMSLSIQRTANGSDEVLRSFNSQEDCTRGSQLALENLDIFMADLFNQLAE